MSEKTAAWFAEHAMGWRPVSGYEAIASEVGVERMPPRRRCHVQRVWFRAPGEQMACDECGDLPDPVNSDTDALQILLCLSAQSIGWDISVWPRQYELAHDEAYQCGIEPTNYGSVHPDWVGWGTDNNFCLAICNAVEAWVLAHKITE